MKTHPRSSPLLQHTLCRHGDAETAGQHVTRDHLVTLLLSDWLSAACFSPDFGGGLCAERRRRARNKRKGAVATVATASTGRKMMHSLARGVCRVGI